MPTISSLQNATASSFLVSGIIEVIRCTTSSICLRDGFFTVSFDHFGPQNTDCDAKAADTESPHTAREPDSPMR